MTPGKFIVIDGGEGSGTTTMSKAAQEVCGDSALWTREPGGSPYAEDVRSLILSEGGKTADAETLFALFWAARRDHLKHTVMPARAAGKTVICDRFDSSTWAYQIRGQEERQLESLFWTVRAHYLEECMPDYYLVLDVSPEEGLSRVEKRGDVKSHFEERVREFHQRVREGFLEFAQIPSVPSVVIDAHKAEDEVRTEVVDIVQKLTAGGTLDL